MTKPSPEYLAQAYSLKGPDHAKRFYDDWAATYDATLQSAEHIAPHLVCRQLDTLGVAKDARIIDLGCGTGFVATSLRAAGYAKPDGLDLSEGMLAQAREKDVYNALFQGDLLAPPVSIDDNAYDVAVSSGVFTHTHVGPQALRECARIVKPGGLCVVLANADFFGEARFLSVIETFEHDGILLLESAYLTPYREDLKGRLLSLRIF